MKDQELYDRNLVEKIISGDKAAFRELFENYKTMVYSICFRMSGNHEEAEDLTQDIFLKIYKSINKYRHESKLSTWVYRIAINFCLNYQRKKKLSNLYSLDFLFENQNEHSDRIKENIPDKLFEKSEKEQIIQKLIESLPKKQKTALILKLYEDLSYKEIAEIMNCSVASVESRLYKAKQNFTKKLLCLVKK